MSPKVTGLRVLLKKPSRSEPAAAPKEETEVLYPLFRFPESNTSSVYSEESFSATLFSKLVMNSNFDLVAMASTISRARLDALVLLSESEGDKFLEFGKLCIDAHAQATRAMMDDVVERIKAGEDFDWKTEIDALKEGLQNYCQAIVKEAESSALQEGNHSFKLSTILTHPSATSSKVSIKTLIGSSNVSASPTFKSDPKTPITPFSDPNTQSSFTMPEGSPDDHLLASSRRRLRLYTVSSEDWIVGPKLPPSSTSPPIKLPENLTPVDESIHLGVIMGIFSKLYTMAKIMQTILMSYGVELDRSRTGLSYWIECSEEYVRSQNMRTLVEIVENLFYAIYARVVIELANIELCGTFRIDLRSLRTHRPFLLPEPDHLYRIVLTFKDVLDSPCICAILRKDILQKFQNSYITEALDKTKDADYPIHDPLGYRLHAASIATKRNGSYYTKWQELIPFFNILPEKLLVMWSEKYLTVAPVRVIPDDIPFDQLPFIDPSQIGYDIHAAETIKDHRMASLAKLEGTSIGEERQKDPKSRIFYLAKQRKCVCQSVCRCSKDCTGDVLHSCPCAERHVRIMIVKHGIHYRMPDTDFVTTAGTLTRMYFHGLASLKRGVTQRFIAQELQRAFESMAHLISIERDKIVPKRSDSEKSAPKKSLYENSPPKRYFSENSIPNMGRSEYSTPNRSTSQKSSLKMSISEYNAPQKTPQRTPQKTLERSTPKKSISQNGTPKNSPCKTSTPRSVAQRRQ